MSSKPTKPNRTVWEPTPKEERIRFLRRQVAEQEARQAAKDYVRDLEELDERRCYPNDPFQEGS